MQKKIILFLILVTCLPFISSLDPCSDTNQIDSSSIPCQGLTNVLDCTGNISILNLNTSVASNITANPLVNGRLNFTVNLTDGSYSFVDCANNSALVEIGLFEQGFGISLFGFTIPAMLLSAVALLTSWRMDRNMSNDEEETEKKNELDRMLGKNNDVTNIKHSRFIPTTFLLFSFLPMIFMVATVNSHLEQYLPEANITSFFGNFYVFFLYTFFFVSLVAIIVVFAHWIDKRRIWRGYK